MADVVIDDLPQCRITACRWDTGTGNKLLLASFEGLVRIYDTTGATISSRTFAPLNVMTACWAGPADASQYAVGLSDGSVRIVCEAGQERTVAGGQTGGNVHSQPVSKLCYYANANLLVSGAWDERVALIDVDAGTLITSKEVDGKVFAMDCTNQGRRLVVCTSNKSIYVFRMDQEPHDALDDPLEYLPEANTYQIRSVSCNPKGTSYCYSTVEGRVKWENFASMEGPTDPYTFKCHRMKFETEEGTIVEKIWPVNVISFITTEHNENAFITAGSDGIAFIWDGVQKKKLWKSGNAQVTSFTDAHVSSSGEHLALAVSYDFLQGRDPPARNFIEGSTEANVMNTAKIVIRKLSPSDFSARSR